MKTIVSLYDPDGKAIACYGLYLPGLNQMLLRFVAGRPVSAVTTTFLAWLLAYFAGQGKAVADPTRLLPMSELMERVCAYYHCELTQSIAQSDC